MLNVFVRMAHEMLLTRISKITYSPFVSLSLALSSPVPSRRSFPNARWSSLVLRAHESFPKP